MSCCCLLAASCHNTVTSPGLCSTHCSNVTTILPNSRARDGYPPSVKTHSFKCLISTGDALLTSSTQVWFRRHGVLLKLLRVAYKNRMWLRSGLVPRWVVVCLRLERFLLGCPCLSRTKNPNPPPNPDLHHSVFCKVYIVYLCHSVRCIL